MKSTARAPLSLLASLAMTAGACTADLDGAQVSVIGGGGTSRRGVVPA